jgi:hypothetical protein
VVGHLQIFLQALQACCLHRRRELSNRAHCLSGLMC